MPKIRCRCKKVLSFKAEQGGKLVVCPSCSAKVRLPSTNNDGGSAQRPQNGLSALDDQIEAKLGQLAPEPPPIDPAPPLEQDDLTLEERPSETRLSASAHESPEPAAQPAYRPMAIAPEAEEPPLRKLPKPEVIPDFWKLLPGVLTYPIKDNGGIALIVGVIFFSVARLCIFAVAFFPLIGGIIAIVIMVVVFGLFVGYLMSIMETSSRGEAEAPDWPDLSDYQEDALKPFLFMLALIAICFGPHIAYVNLAENSNAYLAFAIMAAGIFYMPMGILCIALLNDIGALNPILVIRAICAVFGKYLVAWVLSALCFGAYVLMGTLVDTFLPIPIIGSALQLAITFYFGFAAARVMGLLYYTSRDKLDWIAG